MGIHHGLEKIRIESNVEIACITKTNDQSQPIEVLDTGLEIICSEASLEIVKANCLGLLDALVMVPIA